MRTNVPYRSRQPADQQQSSIFSAPLLSAPKFQRKGSKGRPSCQTQEHLRNYRQESWGPTSRSPLRTSILPKSANSDNISGQKLTSANILIPSTHPFRHTAKASTQCAGRLMVNTTRAQDSTAKRAHFPQRSTKGPAFPTGKSCIAASGKAIRRMLPRSIRLVQLSPRRKSGMNRGSKNLPSSVSATTALGL